MQDAFSKDMFGLGGINNSRCNGHIPVSSPGKVPKRDRKGCKKGKIEAIMKNNLVTNKARVRLQTSPIVKKIKPVQPVSNHTLKTGTIIKSEYIDSDDPYTFTEAEPQTVSLYPGGNNLTLSRKIVPLVSSRSNQLIVNKSGVNMVCVDRNPVANRIGKSLTDRLNSTTTVSQTIELPSRPFVTKVSGASKVVHNLEGSSKTMNKLQADIARNKLMGKRKKMVSNQCHTATTESAWENREIKVENSGNVHSNSPVFAKVTVPARRTQQRQTTWQRERKSRHEALQRIQRSQEQAWEFSRDLYPLGLEVSDSEGEGEEEDRGVYQRHWFMGCVWGNVHGGGGGRDSRLAQVNAELRRRVCQVWHGVRHSSGTQPVPELVASVIDAARTNPISTALMLQPKLKLRPKQSRAKVSMLLPQKCSLDCEQPALPCTRHCVQHIMYNVDQLLFQHCAAKFSDNSQCCVPVFDIKHQQPLCPEHAAIYESAMKKHVTSKSKKCSKKKTKPPALTRSTKRGKKKKKGRASSSSTEMEVNEVEIKTEPMMVDEEVAGNVMVDGMDHMMLHSSPSSSHHASEVFLTDVAPISQQVQVQVQLEDAVEIVSDEVLAIESLDPTELANQASKLLEEHDITTMLNQIPPDAFTDIFLDDKNPYLPTREQTEGLERALEEVDKEVRSLEQMTRCALPLPLPLPLDSITMLDDETSYVTYPNGFTTIAQPVQAQPNLRH